jgi:hypothetical protein
MNYELIVNFNNEVLLTVLNAGYHISYLNFQYLFRGNFELLLKIAAQRAFYAPNSFEVEGRCCDLGFRKLNLYDTAVHGSYVRWRRKRASLL